MYGNNTNIKRKIMDKTTIIATVVALWIFGMFAAYNVAIKKDLKWYEKASFIVLWPFTALLYGVHWLHNHL